MWPFSVEIWWIVTETAIIGIQVSKAEHLPEMPIGTFSTNWWVNLKFHIHASLMALNRPMQEMVTFLW
jgi:hypothetical protein